MIEKMAEDKNKDFLIDRIADKVSGSKFVRGLFAGSTLLSGALAATACEPRQVAVEVAPLPGAGEALPIGLLNMDKVNSMPAGEVKNSLSEELKYLEMTCTNTPDCLSGSAKVYRVVVKDNVFSIRMADFQTEGKQKHIEVLSIMDGKSQKETIINQDLMFIETIVDGVLVDVYGYVDGDGNSHYILEKRKLPDGDQVYVYDAEGNKYEVVMRNEKEKQTYIGFWGEPAVVKGEALATETPYPAGTLTFPVDITPATVIPTATVVPPTVTVVPSEIPTATATQNTEATKQADFEARKAEALKMVGIKLDSPEDFKTLPVLDDVNDFDSGKVQAEEQWLIENVLPPADTKLPTSWRTACNDETGFCWMSYNMISESNIKVYRGATAFFVMRDGIKMLRFGFEYGGPGQLIHFNFEDPKWWTDPKKIEAIIGAFNNADHWIFPIVQYGTTPGSKNELYDREVTLKRVNEGNQFVKDWIHNRQLPVGADRTVFEGSIFDK